MKDEAQREGVYRFSRAK